jgi:2-phosphosulfolactate phosphatase
VAKASRGYQTIGIVPAGEKWPDGSLRPALEDWLGAGAIISNLPGPWSPEAKAAVSASETLKGDLLQALRTCPSGVELIEKGYDKDVALASQYDVSEFAPRFIPPAYRR